MRELLLILITIHGLLHVLGFVKAFRLAPMPQMPHPIDQQTAPENPRYTCKHIFREKFL